MRTPSRLRYVECELPDDIEKTLTVFEDDFEANIKPFYDRLNDLIANDIPLINSELDKQIALRDDLLRGSPVTSMASLAALDKSTGLTDPNRDDTDPETIRIDERKLGATGICLLNGRMFKILPGDRLTVLRHLWEMAHGNYDYFVRLGVSVLTSTIGSYTLFEQNSFKQDRLPFVNKGFLYIDSVGLKNSQYKHRLIWTNSITATYALKSKMVELGYDSEQINNIFSGIQPNASYDFSGTLATILTLIQTITRLAFLPKTDSIRQPPWMNEANYIELAIKYFLTYRLKNYTSSYVFDNDYWSVFLTELRPADIKELLENRPEIKNIELPQELSSITAIVEKAISIPAETAIINTWMNNLPQDQSKEKTLTESLYDLGLSIYKQLVAIGESKRASQLEQLLLELIGKDALVGYFNSPVFIDPQELASLFPSATLPPLGQIVSGVQGTQDRDFTKSALNTNSAIRKFEAGENKKKKKEDTESDNGNIGGSNSPPGDVQGLPSEETFAMILTRRVKWDSNFLDCEGKNAPDIGTSKKINYPSQSMGAFKEFSKTQSSSPGDPTAEWRQHENNLAYIQRRLEESTPAIEFSGTSINDIRVAMIAFVSQNDPSGSNEDGTLTLKDTRISKLVETMNSSNDIRLVASSAVDIMKSVPSATKLSTEKAQLASDALAGEDRGAAMYAAKNRNFVTTQGGQVAPTPDINGSTGGITQGEVRQEVERAIGSKVSWFGQGNDANKILVPFQASTSVELQFCQTKAFKDFDNYLKGLLMPPGWLVRSINIIKQQILVMQEKIDKWIVAAQNAMDAVLAKLERLLTIDLNFSGKLGFENSLFKCSWGVDLGLKINLLDLLLLYLDSFLGLILGPILKLLQLLGDFINEILCVPIRWIGQILNGAMFAAAELLAQIGCTVKDFKLPTEIFDLLGLINGLFSLRSLVFRKGSADWLKMMGRIKLGKNEFTGLSQFASMCVKDNLAASLSALSAQTRLMASGIQTAATNAGNWLVDGI